MARPYAATGWLGYPAVFFNERAQTASCRIDDVLDLASFDWDPDGLKTFLEFGYCAFGRTPVKHVRFLLPGAQLERSSDGALSVVPGEREPDMVQPRRTTPEEVVELYHRKSNEWAASFEGAVCVPLSGGLDSRFLISLIDDKERVQAFTYGLCRRPDSSFEAVYAKEVARRLGVPWQRVPLDHFHDYTDDWLGMFGFSAHAHGMYQMEFYDRIRSTAPGAAVLSGIVGDAYAGSIPKREIRNAADAKHLAHTHGANADPSALLLKTDGDLADGWYEREKDKLNSWSYQIVTLVRTKMMLLRYLLQAPERFGFRPWSPFLDADCVAATLGLPAEVRANRAWQRDYFRQKSLDVESAFGRLDRTNVLNTTQIRTHPLPPLDPKLLGEIVRPDYVESVNRDLWRPNTLINLTTLGYATPYVGGALKRLKVKDRGFSAYYAYLTLLPLQRLIQMRGP